MLNTLSLVICVKPKTLIIKAFWTLKFENETFDMKTLKLKKTFILFKKRFMWCIVIAKNYFGLRFVFLNNHIIDYLFYLSNFFCFISYMWPSSRSMKRGSQHLLFSKNAQHLFFTDNNDNESDLTFLI